MTLVTPINAEQQKLVVDRTLDFIRRAEDLLQHKFVPLPVLFDLKGRASGMYRVRGKQRVIRYNPWIFASHFEDCLATTVPHEVAHYVTDHLFGLRNIRPHGREWQAVMHGFDADASVTANYSLAGIPQRQSRKFSYLCACDTHLLGLQRHRRFQAGQMSYRCRRCGETLRPQQ
jgi:SprT protein